MLAASGLHAQTNYRVNPSTANLPQTGGDYSTVIYYGWMESGVNATLGNATGPKSSDSGSISVFTWPTVNHPATFLWGWAQNTSSPLASFHPQQWFVAVPVGSGLTSPSGTYDTGGNPVDINGNIVDPTTGLPLPGQPARVLLPLQNPFNERPFGFDWDIIEDGTGTVLGQGNAQLAPGQGEKVPITNPLGTPFHVVLYPIVEGRRGSPPQTFNSSGGGSGGSGGVVIGPGQVSPPTTTAPPTTPSTAETHTATQQAINRLATITQAQGEANKQQLSALYEQGERQIKATKDTTTAVNNISIAGGGLTQAQLNASLDAKLGGPDLAGGVDPTLAGEVDGLAGEYGTKGAAAVAKMRSIIGKLQSFISHLSLDRTYSQTNWAWSVSVPVVGTLNCNIEAKWAWVLTLIRGTFTAILCFYFCKRCFAIVRGMFAS